MNFSPSEIEKMQKCGNCSDKDILKILDDCEEIINTYDNYDDFFKYAFLLASNTDMRFSHDIIDRVINILTTFKNGISDAHTILDCEYAFWQLYTKINFTPKIVEHALNVLDHEDSTPIIKYASANELSIQTSAVGLYEIALHYASEAEKLSKHVTGYSPLQLELITETNFAVIMAISGMKGDFPERLAHILDFVEKNHDNPSVSAILSRVSVDILYVKSRLHGITDTLVKEYKNAISDTINSTSISYYFHALNTDILLLKAMSDLDYTTECADIIRMILSHPECFLGDYCAIYKILIDAYSKDPSCLSPSEFNDIREKYILSLEAAKRNHEATIRRLVVEEFNIRKATTMINSLTQESQTDSLTGCLNRNSFNKQSPRFYDSHPEGLVIFMDLDNLKFANDHFGHEAGDLYITTFSNSVKRVVKPETDMFFRYAGDEFVILTSRSEEEAEAIIASVQEILKTPASLKDIELLVKFSHGIASFAECPGDNTLEATVKLADSRMYECKMEHKRLDPTSVR